MTIVQLETFLKITETKNFSTAANMLGYAQSTVTTQIKQLEEELGCLLFERLGKTIVLTEEGERLSVYAQKMLQIEREILLEVPKLEEPTGVLRLGVSESLCYNRLPGLLMQYKEKFPKIKIQLIFINHNTFPLLLKSGALDLVYTINPKIESHELFTLHKKQETLGFYASPQYPIADSIAENDLKDVPLLLTGQDCNFRLMLVDSLTKLSITPNIALETSSKEILKQFAANQLGVAFIPDMVVEKELINHTLKKIKWVGTEFPVFSQILVHKDKHVNPAMKGLIEMIAI